MAISGMTSAGQAFNRHGRRFAFAHGYARAGGNDLARFTGSERSDRLKVDEDLVKLMGGGYYHPGETVRDRRSRPGGGFDSGVVPRPTERTSSRHEGPDASCLRREPGRGRRAASRPWPTT